ncbi:serine/threonine-protein kinase [Nostoc sphaeroides]|uniref:non-specific serine/threonine protein kinase n=1 Tax=Nostoc sphaeroides CCNUC1 TaxID=2653204 RepID=A0A5P8WG40_9NOSO|nr:serine/threonine-protein kinase [Nostoc sphaeroides]QFS51126.1 serine/threonine protein kinase [Nostoc sphaeroides CCNUC1]
MLNQLLAGHYQILKVLGAGGFGQTYVAQDIHRPGNPTCVVKHLKPANSDPAFLQAARHLFEKEAQALEKLGHYPQIPRLLAYFEENQEFYLVQELIEGNVLNTEILPGRRWSESQVVQLLQEILEILDFVHSNGVIHRDIKPNNIIRRQQDNKLVLVDFGIVKQINMQLATAQSQASTSMVIGTLGYMSPEQVRGKPRFSSDIYALGIIAIQALTGLKHHELKEDAKGEVDWQSHAQVNPRLAAILSKMVSYHFQERYESAKEVLVALKFLTVSPGYATTQLDPRPRYSQTEPITNPATVPRSVPESNPVFPSGQHSDSGNAVNNPLASTLQSPISPKGSESNGFVKAIAVIKSPVGVTLAIATFVSILAAFGLDWHKNQNLLASVQEIKSLKQAKEYEKCIEQGVNVSFPSNNSSPYKEAKIELLSNLNECQIFQAKNLATQLNFTEAIKQADKVPKNQPFSIEAQQLINTWSDEVLKQAIEKYEESGDLDSAVITATAIPAKSSNFKEAQELIAKWQKEFKINKDYLKVAQRALIQNRFQDAITAANKISVTQYWHEKKEEIIQEAKSKLEPDNPRPSNASNPAPNPPSRESKAVSPAIAPSKVEQINSNLNSPSNPQPAIGNGKTESEILSPSTLKPTTIDNCADPNSILGQGSECDDN